VINAFIKPTNKTIIFILIGYKPERSHFINNMMKNKMISINDNHVTTKIFIDFILLTKILLMIIIYDYNLGWVGAKIR